MTTIETIAAIIHEHETPFDLDEAQLAAASFLARYSGRTLEAYRHDLRGFFQWAVDQDVDVSERPARTSSCTGPRWNNTARGVDDRSPAVDGVRLLPFRPHRRSHPSNPAQYVRRPQVHPTDARGLDRSEFGAFLFTAEHYDRAHAALAVLLGLNGLRVSEACATNIEDLGLERGHRTSDRRQGQQAGRDPAGPTDGTDDRPGGR